MRHSLLLAVACALLAVILASGYEPPPCPRCTKNLDPVCAKDDYGSNRTYPNACFITYLNCKEGANYQLYSQGECADDPIKYVDDEVDNAPIDSE